MKLKGYAGRKPKDGSPPKGPPKHSVWPGVYIQKGFTNVNGSIKKGTT